MPAVHHHLPANAWLFDLGREIHISYTSQVDSAAFYGIIQADIEDFEARRDQASDGYFCVDDFKADVWLGSRRSADEQFVLYEFDVVTPDRKWR